MIYLQSFLCDYTISYFNIVSIPNDIQFLYCIERIGPQMAVGDKLKEIREQQNLSQLEVANALGVSDRTVSGNGT